MIPPKNPANESVRLASLHSYDILDKPPEKEFDDLVKLASQICETPISLVSLVDFDRQWFKAKVGLDTEETTREVSFCAHAIHDDKMLVVRDALTDERFAGNPLVTGKPNIRFYAGMPLINPEGLRLGTLCVIDTKPRDLSTHQVFALETLSRQVMKQMELKLRNHKLNESLRKIEQQNHKLCKLNRTNTKLLSIISHDLRSPLTTMSGFLTLFETNGLSQEEVLQSTRGLQSLLDSSTDLLDNLLQWGASRATEETIKVQLLNLPALLEDIFANAQLIAQQKDNTLFSHVEKGYTLQADSVMLRFVLRNLIHNALKFTEGGVIEVMAEQSETHHWISIRDSGVGMTADKLEQLFNWETRTSTKGTSGEKGSGLGLILCKEFVEHHHGEMKIESQIGRGSTFSFSIAKFLA